MSQIYLFAHGIHAADGSVASASFWEFVYLGAVHMLTGYDHLLFVLGITFLVKRLKHIVGLITAFTIGHSVTLLLASIAGFTVNYLLIDALIGLSVAYIGFEIVYGQKFRELHKGSKLPDPKFIVYGFGLLHGLGLATRLQDLGLPQQNAIASIIGFNIGVEAGQLLALAIFVTIVLLLKNLKLYDKLKRPIGLALIGIGAIICIVLLAQAL